jgi:tetratricopeptide (TPR) repeat protein
MRKLVPFVLFMTACIITHAQDMNVMKKHYLKIYNQALTYNDVNAATNALHGYLAIDSNIVYKDTLSMLYFNAKSYYSSLILAEEVYKAQPGNYDAMARAAECYDELGDPKTAVGLYEQVVPKTKSPYHVYRLAVGQYQLKRIGEAETSARIVIADTNSKKVGVAFNMGDGSQQAVSANAAAANLLGVIQMDAKNYAQAKTFFNQALTMYPQFAGAKQNLEACERNIKGGGKVPAKAPANKPKG